MRNGVRAARPPALATRRVWALFPNCPGQQWWCGTVVNDEDGLLDIVFDDGEFEQINERGVRDYPPASVLNLEVKEPSPKALEMLRARGIVDSDVRFPELVGRGPPTETVGGAERLHTVAAPVAERARRAATPSNWKTLHSGDDWGGRPDEDSGDDWGGRSDEDSDDDWGGAVRAELRMSPAILDCLWLNVQTVTEKFYALVKARDVTVLGAIARSEKILYTEEESRTTRAVEAAKVVSAKTEAMVKAVLESGEVHQITLSRERGGSFGFGFYSTSGGLLVSLITAGGAAARAGLCYGDVVLSIWAQHHRL